MEDRMLAMILEYQMTKEEALAWKVAILYYSACNKHLGRPYPQLKRDPRKSLVFKHCYKLTQNPNLKPKQYHQYIQAQFHILKNIKKEDTNALIDSNCIASEAAWNRWLVWQKKYENTGKTIQFDEVKQVDAIPELVNTKKFLSTKFELTEKNIIDSLNGRAMFRWVVLQLVSPYFLVLSPTVQRWLKESGLDLLENYVIDLKLYVPTEEMREFYKKEFDV